MNDIQKIISLWADWKAHQLITSVQFTASTNYAAHPELEQYYQYQVNVTQNNELFYGSATAKDAGHLIAGNYDCTNNTTINQSITFDTAYENTDEFSWSITESINIGQEVKVVAKIPFFGEGESKTMVELTVSSAQGKTTTIGQHYNLSIPVIIKPHTHAYGDSTLVVQQYNTNWWVDVAMAGYIAVWFNEKVDFNNPEGSNLHWLWFIPIQVVFQEVIDNDLISIDGYTVISGGVKTMATGQYTSSVGAKITIHLYEKAIDSEQIRGGINVRSRQLDHYLSEKTKHAFNGS